MKLKFDFTFFKKKDIDRLFDRASHHSDSFS